MRGQRGREGERVRSQSLDSCGSKNQQAYGFMTLCVCMYAFMCVYMCVCNYMCGVYMCVCV